MNKKLGLYRHRFLIIFIMSLFGLFFYSLWNVTDMNWMDYLLLALLGFNIIVAIETTVQKGLIISMFILLTYGGIIFYQSITGDFVQLKLHYIWLAAFPICTMLGGLMGEQIKKMEHNIELYKKNYERYRNLDLETGFGNLNGFLTQLEVEMAEAKRYDYPLTIGIIEILYFDELLAIHDDDLSEVFNILSDALKEIMRIEDTKFRIDEKTFAIILPHTPMEGAEILKKRIKEKLLHITIQKESYYKNYKFEIRMGVKPYAIEYESPLEYKRMAEKELEYDV
ncbi:MAG: GGDEF domain-containing protein [Tissierellales bacterium]|jgi:GGDEF domain-containing protein|nr:GGDEF domain-containing protein [Tissierellales bacterium]